MENITANMEIGTQLSFTRCDISGNFADSWTTHVQKIYRDGTIMAGGIRYVVQRSYVPGVFTMIKWGQSSWGWRYNSRLTMQIVQP